MHEPRRQRPLGGGDGAAPGARPARLRSRGRRGGRGLSRDDPFDLGRFHAAQDGGVHAGALRELHAGHKTGHWMWFVFPQLAGLGRSPTARRYAISGAAEARAYLADPVLGARLRACAGALLDLPADATAHGVLGAVDALKLHSSMTLFARVAGTGDDLFARVLERFHGGDADAATVHLLAERG